MKTVNVYEAKTHLSKLLDLAASGEEVVIARAGKPLAKLISYTSIGQPRKPGYWKGKVKIARDFDELPSTISSAFQGEST
ncbi:MAG: type II toxin-antitoxin system prevent-host-death family antitoxin [Nitrospirae bacterium]|nr:type II toxin-antitoxin system prevent-host-death family antitoxin [Nitrospirota bacterium]MDA1303041.1 type II toxin-antitoxin system prevent-host-death family antitoxin [Nitrospirota bacterium]